MIKLFLVLVVLICCILIGFLVSNYYKKRKLFFIELLSFIQFLKTYVKQGNEKLSIIIDKFTASSCDALNLLLLKYKEFINNRLRKVAFENFINNNLNFLKEREKRIVFDMFVSFGCFDEICELNNLEIYESNLENMVNKTTNESNKFSPFAIKMSLLIGSMILIIFI